MEEPQRGMCGRDASCSWAAYVYLCRARAVGVFRRPGRSRCVRRTPGPGTRVRRNARLGCAQRLSRLPSRLSPVRRSGLVVSLINAFSRSVMFCARPSSRCGSVTSAVSAHVHTIFQSVSFVYSFVAVPPRSPTSHIHKSHPPACDTSQTAPPFTVPWRREPVRR